MQAVIQINKKSEHGIWMTVVFSTVFMFLYSFYENNVFLLMGIAVMFVPVMFMKLNECMYMLFFYVSNIRMLRLLDGGNTLFGFIVILIFIKYIVTNANALKLKMLLPILLMGAVVIVTSVISADYGFVSSYIRFGIGFFLVIIYLQEYGSNLEGEYHSIKKWFIYGCVSTVVCGLVWCMLKGQSPLATRFAGVRNDPNYYSIIMGVAFSFLLVDLVKNKQAGLKESILTVVILVAGMMSVSRGFLFGIAINIFLVLYLLVSTKSMSAGKKMLLFFFIVLFVLLFEDMILSIIKSYSDRLQDRTELLQGNGRMDIESEFLVLWKRNFLTVFFGTGDGSILYEKGIVSAVHHNYYIELLTSIGIIGILMMLNIYRVLFKTVFHNYKFRLKPVLLFPLATYAIMLISLGALFSDTHLISIVLILIQYRVLQEKSMGKEQLE